VWRGERLAQTINWLRWWDTDGNLLLWSAEQANAERQRAEAERQRAEAERQRAERLAELLRAQGIDPDQV
jgi:regulator of protease activity HflC (stomatin/prohibitin superfamily)